MLRFVKYHGLGNDFVVIDRLVSPREAVALCDRRFGVGADGVLMVLPSEVADARMRVLNADGSEAEMCGNGIRCVAKVLYESDPTLRRPVLRIDTGAGLLECAVDVVGGEVRTVAVEMGRPRFARDEIPMQPGGA